MSYLPLKVDGNNFKGCFNSSFELLLILIVTLVGLNKIEDRVCYALEQRKEKFGVTKGPGIYT